MRVQEEIEHCINIEFKKATVIASDQAARDAKKKLVSSSKFMFCDLSIYK